MKKIIILIVCFYSLFNASYGENLKNIEGMYLSDGYYIGKIKGIDFKNNIVKFDNYINFYNNSPVNDFLKGNYRIYNFKKGYIDSFYLKDNKNFLEKNKNEKYIIFYVNNYVDNFYKGFTDKNNVNVKYLSFIKCNSDGKIYFDTHYHQLKVLNILLLV